MRASYLPVCLLLAAMLPACGTPETGPTAEEQIGEVVADVSDASFDRQRFAALFAGNPPAEAQRQRYRIYMFRTRSIEIIGETATATVEIEHGTSGEIAGEFPWQLQREGEAWRLIDAPLPPS